MRKVLYIMGFLSDEDVEWMADTGRVVRPRPGDVLITQGRPAAEIFFLLEGECVVEVKGAGIIARLGSGEVMGEMSFVDSAPPSATIRAGDNCAALALDRRDISGRIAENVAFAARFYKALAVFLADRLRGATQRMAGGAAGLDADAVMENELDDGIMDQVSQAGLRFEHMLARLLGTAPRSARG